MCFDFVWHGFLSEIPTFSLIIYFYAQMWYKVNKYKEKQSKSNERGANLKVKV